MSKIKIYDGVVIDMATSEVISHGDVSYVDSEDVAYTKGGGGTSTSTSGFAEEHKPYVTRMLADAEGLYGSGQLGKVVGFTPTQLAAQKQGITAAGAQTGLEGSLASKPLVLMLLMLMVLVIWVVHDRLLIVLLLLMI